VTPEEQRENSRENMLSENADTQRMKDRSKTNKKDFQTRKGSNSSTYYSSRKVVYLLTRAQTIIVA
jgi:hypothetical protein